MPFPYSPPDYKYVTFVSAAPSHKLVVYQAASTLEQARELGRIAINRLPCWYGAFFHVKKKEDCTEQELSRISVWKEQEQS